MRLEYHNPALPILTDRFADFAVETPRWNPDVDGRERGVILHPTDYSAAARHAFELACRLARSRASRLIVLHVAEPLRSPTLGMAPVPDLPRNYRAAWESQLQMVRPSEPDVPVEHRLEVGDAATEILRVARDTSSELIVMGTGGRARWLPGSVARTVSRHALCPVFAVNAPTDDECGPRGEAPRRVLHPTDFSISSRYALDVARCLVRDSGGELVLVHVASVPLLQSKRGYQAEMEEALRWLAESDPDVPARWQLRVGGAAVQIAQAARDHSCDLIVMGAENRSLLRRLGTDSVARHVEQEVPCPVAAVQCPSSSLRPAPILAPQRGGRKMKPAAWNERNARMTQEQLDCLGNRVRHARSGRLRDFELKPHGSGLVLRGRSRSYHDRQAAHHAVRAAIHLPIVENEIEVS